MRRRESTVSKVKKRVSILDSGNSLFKIEELMAELRISRPTAYRLVSGDAKHPPVIPSIKIGHLRRVTRSVVEQILAGELPAVGA